MAAEDYRLSDATKAVIDQKNAERSELIALRARVAAEACDACAGTGKTTHGGPCMCGGSGRMADAALYLRARVAELETDAARYRWLRVNGGWNCTPEAADKLIDDAMREDRDAGNKPPGNEPAQRIEGKP